MMSKKELLRKIQVFDFALQEASLFLNSHPNDKAAMQYYQEHKDKKDRTVAIYEKCYGPLTNRSNHADTWEYVYAPWPWEGEDEHVDL